MTTLSKLYAPETLNALRLRFKHSAIAGYWRQAIEFGQVYSVYRRAGHRPSYSAWIAWQIAVNRTPF